MVISDSQSHKLIKPNHMHKKYGGGFKAQLVFAQHRPLRSNSQRQKMSWLAYQKASEMESCKALKKEKSEL